MRTFPTSDPITATIELGAGAVRISAADRADTQVRVTPRDPMRPADVRAAEQAHIDVAGGALTVLVGRKLLSPTRGAVNVDIELPSLSSVSVAVLQRLLDLPEPVYRHHLLLLEQHGGKLAKRHGAVAAGALRRVYDAPALVGFLACAAGLCERPDPVTPAELLRDFSWARVRSEDRGVRWTGDALQIS